MVDFSGKTQPRSHQVENNLETSKSNQVHNSVTHQPHLLTKANYATTNTLLNYWTTLVKSIHENYPI